MYTYFKYIHIQVFLIWETGLESYRNEDLSSVVTHIQKSGKIPACPGEAKAGRSLSIIGHLSNVAYLDSVIMMKDSVSDKKSG